MDRTWTVGANCGKEVLTFQVVCKFVETFAISSEEDSASSGLVADANDVSLDISWTIWRRGKRLVESSMSGRDIRNRRLVIAWIG
jgi:hypothetical protein